MAWERQFVNTVQYTDGVDINHFLPHVNHSLTISKR